MSYFSRADLSFPRYIFSIIVFFQAL